MSNIKDDKVLIKEHLANGKHVVIKSIDEYRFMLGSFTTAKQATIFFNKIIKYMKNDEKLSTETLTD